MSGAAIRNAVAAKVASLAHARHTYSVGATGSVSGWPVETLDDGPHALVARGPSSRSAGTGNQWLDRGVDVEFRFSAVDVAEAQRLIDALEDEIVVEFSSGITLGGLVAECVYLGSERPTRITDEDEREWIVWLTHFRARERFATEMTP